MIGRRQIRDTIRESVNLRGVDDEVAMRSLGIDPDAIADEAIELATRLDDAGLRPRAGMAVAFTAGVELGFRLAERHGKVKR
jgi:hypothetical protein